MNFTREPIIETIITPREGGRLVVRPSKHDTQEEFIVDAVEVVSFGQALFFRNLEKPRPFLVPVTHYEVVEVKESRAVLKSASFDRTIKIGGGREAPLRKEDSEELDEQVLPIALEEEVSEESAPQPTQEKRRDRRRHRRRRAHEEKEELKQRPESSSPEAKQEAKPTEPSKETPSLFTHLIPPPPTLISKESISKYKEQQNPPAPEPKKEEHPPQQEPEGDSNLVSRVSLEPSPLSTQFSSLNDWSHF